MKPETFFDNFEVLADAPNGVQKLREMILQLAVRGKLVAQDANDEPASVLLKGIRTERDRLIKEKKIKKNEPLPSIDSNDMQYSIPKSWQWVHLGEIGQVIGGGTPDTKNPDYFTEKGISWLTPADLYGLKDKYIGRGRRDLSERGLKDSSAQLMPAGTVLFSSRAPIGYVAIAKNELATNQGFKSLIPYIVEMNEYIYHFLKKAGKEIDESASGTTFKEIPGKDFVKIKIPLPPLAEQHRIVAKVDQLMSLCDELEARQQKKRESRAHLNSAALDRLLAARAPGEFAEGWRRIYDNFDLLYDAPENVGALRQAILQLAVMGKLVEQDERDESAAVPLEKIKAEKERLIKKKEIRPEKTILSIAVEKMPFEVPKGWIWKRLGEITKSIEYGTSHKSLVNNIGVPVFRMNNIGRGKIIHENMKYVPNSIDDLPKLFLRHNDILFNRTNSYELVGKTGIFKGESDVYTFASYLIRISLFMDYIHPEYVNIAMNSGYFRKTQIEPEIVQQCGQANFNGTKLANTVIPLPPMEEQRRIVTKVDRIMSICDELEAKLARTQVDGEKLIDEVVGKLFVS